MNHPTTPVPTGEPTGHAELPPWAEGLNAEQRAAVEHGDGPLLVVAGAGTGKTRTLVARLARLIEDGVAPERILLVTFSRRAAGEMVRRAGQLTSPAAARRVHAGTFHAIAHRLLRRHAPALGLPTGFSVLDAADAADLMGLCRPQVPGGPRRRVPRAATLVSIYSRVVNSGTPLDGALGAWFPWCLPERDLIAETFRAYTARKRAQAVLDLDDLLVYWRAATTHPTVGPVMAGLFDHILVDEYQDTNALQADILRALAARTGNVTAVGDDAQAVYSFRAATVDNMVRFADHYTSVGRVPVTVTLEQNYRSTQPILDLANRIMEGHGCAKTLRSCRPGGLRPVLSTCPDEAAQAEAVCETVLEHHEAGIALRDQAVLFRAGHHADALELELGRRNIPFVKYGGLRFLEAAHVRDLLSLLRLLENPYDELAWSRALQLVEGVGPAGAARLAADLDVHRGRPDRPGDPLARFVQPDRPCPPRANRDELSLLASALGDCRAGTLGPGAQLERLAQALDPLVRRRYEHPEARLADLAALARLAASATSRAELLCELTLDPPAATGAPAGPPHLDEDWLVLSTVHSAKGGEWAAVHVVGATDGNFPSDMATGDPDGIAEERRLFYVALTRARRHLHLYAPLRYHFDGPGGLGDRHTYGLRTRFLPPDLDTLLDHRPVRSAAADGPGESGTAATLTTVVDGALGGLW